jgi:hypothetical protein
MAGYSFRINTEVMPTVHVGAAPIKRRCAPHASACLLYMISLLKEPLILLRAEARLSLKDLPEGTDCFISYVIGHFFLTHIHRFHILPPIQSEFASTRRQFFSQVLRGKSIRLRLGEALGVSRFSEMISNIS